MKKKLLFTLFVTVIVLAVLALTAVFSSAETYSGKCGANGDNVKWSLDTSTGVLSITGEGQMKSFNSEIYVPWRQYNDYITSVTIDNGVTSIGPRAFQDIKSLTSVTIPDSVVAISIGTFCDCINLTSVTWPGGVTEIPDWTFSGCKNLKNINIPEGVTRIGSFAFNGCTGLISVTIPGSVTSIDNYAFMDCFRLAEVVNHSSLSIAKGSESNGEVAYHALSVHTKAKSLIKDVDGFRFITHKGNNYLLEYTGSETNLVLPDDYNGNDYSIYKYAFNQCGELTSVTIPGSVTNIGEFAFSGCSGLTSITIPDGVTGIDNYAFNYCSGLTSIIIPSSVKSIGFDLFYECQNLTAIYFLGSQEQWDQFNRYMANAHCHEPDHFDATWDTVKEATCTEEGEKHADCWYCGGETRKIPAKGHNYGEWITTKLPDFYEPGEETRYCSDCDEYETQAIPSLEAVFGDLSADKWYTKGVAFCYGMHYMSGTTENKFSPNATLTRAMFVTILSKIDGADTSTYDGVFFRDVPEGKWFSKPVAWAAANGYAGGTGDGFFSPDAPVTRETLAQFFFTYSKAKGYDVSYTADLSVYTDEGQIAKWAKDAVSWAVGAGLISGTSATTVSPKATATRAQVALIVMNYVEKFAG